ncbi:MAG: hypothetical protein RL318_338 [Fibrobacterota bacterium]|jgi:hypothetical protein
MRKSILSNFNGDIGGLPNKNLQGGYWFAFTDTTSGTPGLANGKSSLFEDENTIGGIQYIPGDEANRGVAGITATLDKGDAGLHPRAGWASMGTGFKDKATGDDTWLDLTGLGAISFSLFMADSFDVENLTGVTFKVGNQSVADSVAFSVGVPHAMNNQTICLDLCQFTQPNWYSRINGGAKGIPEKDIGKIHWELRINNDTAVRAKVSSFYIGDVTFWNTGRGNCATTSGTGDNPSRKPSLVANYANGLILSYALDGAGSATIEVVRMDGAKVASFDGAAKMTNASFPVNLARGTYLAVVRHGASHLVAPFAVMR